MRYIELKSTIAEAERENGLHELDFLSREILHKIAAANLMKQTVRVSSIGETKGWGTMPTVYARVKKLVDQGWIEKIDDPDDARASLLQVTPKARSVFRKISNTLVEF